MPKRIVIEEFHLTIYVPVALPPAESRAVRSTVTGIDFRIRLRQTVLALVRRYRSLRTTSVTVSR